MYYVHNKKVMCKNTCRKSLQWHSKELLLSLTVQLSISALWVLLHLLLCLSFLQKCYRTELGSVFESSNHLLDTLLEDALGLGLHLLT